MKQVLSILPSLILLFPLFISTTTTTTAATKTSLTTTTPLHANLHSNSNPERNSGSGSSDGSGDGDDPSSEYKYFHEPGMTEILGHYDARFFHAPVPYSQHGAELRHLIRSYLTTLRDELGVATWLAHGTLLGWWWNGRAMPWDYDHDVQVSSTSMEYLARRYNHTFYSYSYSPSSSSSSPYQGTEEETKTKNETRTKTKKTYLLDINPFHALPTRGKGLNVIDARWIDTSNGMFIDITALRERDPSRRPGMWSCKNFHRYRTTELWPMRETEFEGVPALVPYGFWGILAAEYGGKAMEALEWQGLVLSFSSSVFFLFSRYFFPS